VQKLQTGSDTGSVTLTRDPTRPDPTRRGPANITDPMTRDTKTRFHRGAVVVLCGTVMRWCVKADGQTHGQTQ